MKECAFVCLIDRKDRITIQEKEKEEHKLREREDEVKRMAEERRKQTLKVSGQLNSSQARWWEGTCGDI